MPPTVNQYSGLLEEYLPRYTFRHRYTTVVQCGDLARVYGIARDVDLSRSPLIRLLFRLRGLQDRAHGHWRARAFCRAMGWTELAQSPPAEFLVAYWRRRRIEPIHDAAQFKTAMPGATQQVGFAFRFRQLDGQRVEIATETRVLCLGWRSKLAFFAYWIVIKPFSGLIRKEILRLIRQEAEGSPDITGQPPPNQMVVRLPLLLLAPLRLYFQLAARLHPPAAAGAFKALLSHMPRKQLSAREQQFLDSGVRLALDCGDAVLAGYRFERADGPAQKKTVLLVHGLQGSAANFHALAPALVRQGYRVVAFDAVNHGNSPAGTAFSRHSIDHLRQVIAQLGPLHALVCHSAGAYLSMLALLQPGCRVNRCVYLAPYPDIATTLRTFTAYLWVPQTIEPALQRWLEDIGGLPFGQQTMAHCLPRQRTPQAPRQLLIHDADDRHISVKASRAVVAQIAQQTHAQLPAQLHVSSGLGHFRLLRDEAVIARIAAFLADDKPSGPSHA